MSASKPLCGLFIRRLILQCALFYPRYVTHLLYQWFLFRRYTNQGRGDSPADNVTAQQRFLHRSLTLVDLEEYFCAFYLAIFHASWSSSYAQKNMPNERP